MDFSKLKKSEQIIAVGAVVGAVSAFLPWYSWSYNVWGVSSSGGVNGMTGWWMFSFIAALLAGLMVVLPLFGVKLPKLGVENKIIYMILGGVAGGIPVLALISGASGTSAVAGFGSAGPSFGLFGAIAGGAVILFGAFMDKDQTKPSEPTAPKEDK